jgi:hypothetical protein
VETLVSREMLAKAMGSNPRWASRLGWSAHMGVIATLVGSATTDAASPELAEAVADWQKGNALDVDGIIGPTTWRALRIALAPEGSITGIMPADTPPVPIGWEQVVATFGDPTPLLSKDGTMTKENELLWQRRTLASGTLPFPVPLDMNKPDGQMKMSFHAHHRMVGTFEAVFGEIHRLGLQAKILSWGGIYNFRPIRGTKRALSLHAFGAAIDLNAETNKLGTEGDMSPEVVEVFRHFGFVWGGDFGSRPDPMHFQYAKGY